MTRPGDEVVQRLPLPGEVASDPDTAGDEAAPATGGVRRLVIEIVETLVLTAVIFFVIQTFVAQPFEVKQMSMERTLEPGHYVLVYKLTPRFDAYHLGDIVVFDPPDSWSDGGTPFIKRVIGREGDRVEVLDSGKVAVNGTVLDEPYLFRSDASGPTDPTEASGETSWTVGKGELFVMGDHRGNSIDSRVFGMIPVGNVVGRAWLRYWPLDVFGLLGGSDAGATPATD